jgi:hypothetical protein
MAKTTTKMIKDCPLIGFLINKSTRIIVIVAAIVVHNVDTSTLSFIYSVSFVGLVLVDKNRI